MLLGTVRHNLKSQHSEVEGRISEKPASVIFQGHFGYMQPHFKKQNRQQQKSDERQNTTPFSKGKG